MIPRIFPKGPSTHMVGFLSTKNTSDYGILDLKPYYMLGFLMEFRS